MLLLLLPPLLQTHRTAVLMSTTGYFAGQSTAVVEILQSSAPGQQAAPLISQWGSSACEEGRTDRSCVPTAPAATDHAVNSPSCYRPRFRYLYLVFYIRRIMIHG